MPRNCIAACWLSIRGMAILATLQEAGFSIWPFDRPGWTRVIEIYPRLLTVPVRKSSGPDRVKYIAATGVRGSSDVKARAASTEDAFDAAISAFVMWKHAAELEGLLEADSEVSRAEGLIWHPEAPATSRSQARGGGPASRAPTL